MRPGGKGLLVGSNAGLPLGGRPASCASLRAIQRPTNVPSRKTSPCVGPPPVGTAVSLPFAATAPSGTAAVVSIALSPLPRNVLSTVLGGVVGVAAGELPGTEGDFARATGASAEVAMDGAAGAAGRN